MYMHMYVEMHVHVSTCTFYLHVQVICMLAFQKPEHQLLGALNRIELLMYTCTCTVCYQSCDLWPIRALKTNVTVLLITLLNSTIKVPDDRLHVNVL